MTGKTRRTVFVRAAVILALLGLSACKQPLYEGLSEREANEIIAVLIREGVTASKQVNKGDSVTVLVDQERFADAVDILNRYSLPRQKYQSFGDVFEKGGLLSSPLEEKARFIYARSQEISDTIAHIDGVLDARVHVVPPSEDTPGQRGDAGEASVFIRYDNTFVLDEILPQIKRLVANSIEAVPYENVSVLMLPVSLTDTSLAGQGPAVVPIMGLQVAPSSAGAIRWLVFGLVFLGVGFLALAVYAVARDPKLRGLVDMDKINRLLANLRRA